MSVIKRKVKPNTDNSHLRKPFRKKHSRENHEIEGRWEVLAMHLAKGASITDAYHAAGYYGGPSNASTIASKPEVKRRVAELRAQMRVRMKVTVETLVNDLSESRERAIQAGKIGDEISATMAIAKLLGLLVEKGELSVIMKPASAPTDQREISLEEWQAKWAPKALPPPKGDGRNGSGSAPNGSPTDN